MEQPELEQPRADRVAKAPGLAELFMCGINHRTAGAKLRRRLSWGDDERNPKDAVLITAPGRLELLACGKKQFGRAREELFRRLAMAREIKQSTLAAHSYGISGEEALHHLCRLASGLDSPTPGDSSLPRAVKRAEAQSAALAFLLDYATATGERVAAETELFLRPSTISAVAVAIAEEIFADGRQLAVGVWGDAEQDHAASLAAYMRHHKNWRFSGRVGVQTDILILSNKTFTADDLKRLVAKRPLAPLFIIDTATPSTELPNSDSVFYYDLNDLEQRALRSYPPQTIAAAEKLVEAAVRSYPHHHTIGDLGALRRSAKARAAALAAANPQLGKVELAQELATRMSAEFLAAAAPRNRRRLAKRLGSK